MTTSTNNPAQFINELINSNVLDYGMDTATVTSVITDLFAEYGNPNGFDIDTLITAYNKINE